MSIKVECEHPKCDSVTELFDLVEAAKEIGIHPESLRRYIRYGYISGRKINGGHTFTMKEILQLKETKELKESDPAMTWEAVSFTELDPQVSGSTTTGI
tara:strand:- start:485 stop:781 length:297 start_codon:yes stop_codon:yes gene_type:complete